MGPAGVPAADGVGSRYCEDCQVSQVTDGLISPASPGVRAYALDPERAKALWSRSEELVGERFCPPTPPSLAGRLPYRPADVESAVRPDLGIGGQPPGAKNDART